MISQSHHARGSDQTDPRALNWPDDIFGKRRVTAMVEQMDLEGFGGCTNTGECTAVCPKEIELEPSPTSRPTC